MLDFATKGIFITPASGIAAPQCGNYDDALVAAKSEVGRYIMAVIPTTSGTVISVGIFLIATLGSGDPRKRGDWNQCAEKFHRPLTLLSRC